MPTKEAQVVLEQSKASKEKIQELVQIYENAIVGLVEDRRQAYRTIKAVENGGNYKGTVGYLDMLEWEKAGWCEDA